jgi:tRNA A37 threonylcarbamoyltransferase TsaD
MNKLKSSLVWLLLAGGVGALTACEEGPLEEAGEEIDDAADDVGDALDRD